MPFLKRDERHCHHPQRIPRQRLPTSPSNPSELSPCPRRSRQPSDHHCIGGNEVKIASMNLVTALLPGAGDNLVHGHIVLPSSQALTWRGLEDCLPQIWRLAGCESDLLVKRG